MRYSVVKLVRIITALNTEWMLAMYTTGGKQLI